MKPEYYKIYTDMLYAYHGSRWLRAIPQRVLKLAVDRDLRMIELAVNDACKRMGVKLRPDAKFFLITNFHQMVVVPVSSTADRYYVEHYLQELIRADIDLIISMAAKVSPREEGISGGAILRTTAELWEKLKTNAEQIWT